MLYGSFARCYHSVTNPFPQVSTPRLPMKAFARFRLDPVNQCLWRRAEAEHEERVLLAPKAFSVLTYLVDHAGRLVTHDELLNAVWSSGVVAPQREKNNRDKWPPPLEH